MISVAAAGNGGLMRGLLERMGQGGAARVRLYSGARQAPGAAPASPLVALVLLAAPAGVIDAVGDLVLSPAAQSLLLQSTAPTWATVSDGNDELLFDCDARTSADADLGQELVIAAPAGLYAGALLQIQSGTFSARP